MPKFAKKSLSFLLRNDCHRQFRLSLYSDVERQTQSLPPRQTARAGSGQVGQAGDHYQADQLANVEKIFGSSNVQAAPPKPGDVRPQPSFLYPPPDTREHFFDITALKPFQFLVEGRFELPENFRQHFGIDSLKDEWVLKVEWADLQPDIIIALPSRKDDPKAEQWAITLDGDTVALAPDDERTQLRIVDIKLASEPGAHYFAEVVYYSMALAGWLEQHNLDDRFVVSTRPAVWPGSYAKSALSKRYDDARRGIAATTRELITAMEEDLETAEVGVYVPPLRRFFSLQLRRLVQTPWDSLDWFVCFRCQNCEFLGYPWPVKSGGATNDPRHCWPMAKSDDRLCRIADLSRGAAKTLEGVAPHVADVRVLPSSDPVWQQHPMLRARGEVFRARAESLETNTASAIAGSGATATMPTFCDLKLFVFLDYDAATSFTAATSVIARWKEPQFRVAPGATGQEIKWEKTFVNRDKTIPTEEGQVLSFLKQLRAILKEISDLDDAYFAPKKAANKYLKRADYGSTYQIYLWDEAQFRHLKRIIERHFSAIIADKELRSLAWLFPPDDVVPHPEVASRESPISFLSPTVDHHVAVPVPHHYTLLRVAQTYLPAWLGGPLSLHPLFFEPLTNLIPGERLHEAWDPTNPDWHDVQSTVIESNFKKTRALQFIESRIVEDARKGIIALGESAAPKLIPEVFKVADFRNPTNESQLWHEFTRLNAALQKVEVEQTYALPPVEREAKFEAAHLKRRLAPHEEAAALAQMSASCHRTFATGDVRWIYELAPDSRDVKFKDGDFLIALSPRSEDLFIQKSVRKRLPATNAHFKALDPNGNDIYASIGQSGLTNVALEALDRQNLLISLVPGDKCQIPLLESLDGVDFATDVMLDKTPGDFLSAKVKLTLQGLGVPKSFSLVPPLAPLLDPTRALVAPHNVTGPNRLSKDRPGHDFLYWPHLTVAQPVARPVAALRAQVKAHGRNLNPSQERAFDEALSKRLSLIWGPPGTGKSATLGAILLGAIENARATKKALRILVTANTYTAVDNVLLSAEEMLRDLGLSLPASSTPVAGKTRIFRVQSTAREEAVDLKKHPHLLNIPLEKKAPSPEAIYLTSALDAPDDGDIILVGAPTHQVHNLAVAGTKENPPDTQKGWFDIVIMDEASQVDVASSVIALTKVAPGGSVVLAGDHLQLPPIHAADTPRGMENFVGPAFSFFVEHHKLHKLALDDNYRSNQTIVNFVREAGYDASLQAHFGDLELNLLAPIPTTKPSDWPTHLPFSEHYAQILDPQRPLGCFVSEDATSGQSNPFEAQTVAALAWLLWTRQAKAFSALHHSSGKSAVPYTASEFWEHGIGIVAPHRAQCSLITERLAGTFLGCTPSTGATPQGIRAAVDTVERYQGQERDVIFASFGLGDPDLIALEDEFLYDLNRFNVLVSRAATKAFVMLSRPVEQHLADDQDVLRASRLLKNFVGVTCRHAKEIELPFFDTSGVLQTQKGELRWA